MNEDKVIEKLLEHEEQLEFIRDNMAAKSDLHELSRGQDQMIEILQRALKIN